MIQEFSIKNYLSFKERQTLSFEASKDVKYEDFFCYEVKPGVRLLKLIVFYGANASGKTNIIYALKFLREVILFPKNTKKDKIKCIPFLLDEKSKYEPSEFDLVFYIDSIKYKYSLKLNKYEILEEKLYYYPSIQPALFFSRKNNNNSVEIKFGSTIQINSQDKRILQGNTIANTSVIGAFSKSNIKSEQLNILYNWFSITLMDIVLPKTDLFGWTSSNVEKSDVCKKCIVELLESADFNISDIRIEDEKIKIDSNFESILNNFEFPDKVKNEIIESGFINLKKIDFLHKTTDHSVYLSEDRESRGTIRYFELGGLLDQLINNNRIIIIDEIDNSLHSDLIKHFLKTFLVNSNNSQLIITTHNQTLLNEDLLRRDSIFFCQKKADGSTETYSVFDFGLHKNVSIYNSYRIGKLGAVPLLGDIYLNNHVKKN